MSNVDTVPTPAPCKGGCKHDSKGLCSKPLSHQCGKCMAKTLAHQSLVARLKGTEDKLAKADYRQPPVDSSALAELAQRPSVSGPGEF